MINLEKLIEQNKGEIAKLRQAILCGSQCSDEGDQAFEQETRLVAISKIKRAEAYQRRLRIALRKFHLGEFGFCEDCGIEIGNKRLLMVPDAPCCVDCQAIREEKGVAA